MNQREPHRRKVTAMPPRMIIFSFMGIIACGTLLLMLPISCRAGRFTPLTNALFTATSATCVTGLVVYDTATYWSAFGQVVILMLIQVGGLGLLTFTTFFNLVIGKKVGLRGMQIASESINSDTVAEMPRLVRMVVKFSLIFEGAGAALLALYFVPRYGGQGVWVSVFTAISAFCNAGFDVLGAVEAPFVSLCRYNGNPWVLFTVMALIITGGLGFVVWRDLAEYRKARRLQLHTKVVLIMTGALVVAGAAAFLLMEWGNPATMQALPVPQRFMAALFQSVTCRTAGFNSIDIGAMGEATKFMSSVLMFIGAAPGSTGGGIKVTSLAVIIMTVVCVTRGREDTLVMKRKVSKNVVYKALAVTLLALLVVTITATTITATNRALDGALSGLDVVFESVSAFGTVGLSAGVTAVANVPSKIVLILTMFIGRVGPVTFVLSLAMRMAQNRKEIIPEGKIYL